MTETTDSRDLRRAWEAHPRYRYRGCAPDVDEPRRAAGNLELTLDAWSGEDRDGGEPQKVREARQAAAVEVCLNCPVMVECDRYATSVVWEKGVPKLAEPEGVWGGRLALERHRRLIASRPETRPAPDRILRTPQKQAVLRALAVCWEPHEVAEAAGLDVRTANWQRSSIVTKLGLSKDASRMRLLAVARERGLLEDVDVVADDGTVPAVAPPTKVPAPAAGSSVLEASEASSPAPAIVSAPAAPARAEVRAPEVLPRGLRPRRRPVAAVRGQLSFDDALTPAAGPTGLAAVSSLFPVPAAMEAAA